MSLREDTTSPSPKPDPPPVRKCLGCNVRISREDLDPHTLCIPCRGVKCNLKDGCDICKDWSEDKMKVIVRLYANLVPKKASKVKKRKALKTSSSRNSRVLLVILRT